MLLTLLHSSGPPTSPPAGVRYGLLLALTSDPDVVTPPVEGVRYGLLLALTCDPDPVRRLNVTKTSVVSLNPVRTVVPV